MADDVAITAGTGTTIATDDVGGKHYQRMKISDGVADSAVHLAVVTEDAASAGGETGIIAMLVRRDTPSTDTSAAGDWAIPQVNAEGSARVEPTRKVATVTGDLTGVTTASTNYTAGDVLGTIVPLTSMAQAAGRHCTILSASFVDNSDVLGPFDVVIFDANPTAPTDNAVPNTSDTDALTIVGILSFPGFTDLGGARVAQALSGLPLTMKTNASANLYAMFVTRTSNAFFTAATTERLKLVVEQH